MIIDLTEGEMGREEEEEEKEEDISDAGTDKESNGAKVLYRNLLRNGAEIAYLVGHHGTKEWLRGKVHCLKDHRSKGLWAKVLWEDKQVAPDRGNIWKFTLECFNPARCLRRGGWCFQEAALNTALSSSMGLRAEGRAEAPVPAAVAAAPTRAAKGGEGGKGVKGGKGGKGSSAPSSHRAVPSTAPRTTPRTTPRPTPRGPSAPRAPSTQQVCTYRGGQGYTHYFCLDLHDAAEHFHVATLQADAFFCHEKCDLKSTSVKEEISDNHPEAIVLYISWLEVVEGCRGKRLGIAMVVMLQKLIAELCPDRQLIMLLAVMPNGKFMKAHEQETKLLTAYYEQAGFQRYATKAGTKGIPWMIKDCSAPAVGGCTSRSYEEVEQKALLLKGAGKGGKDLLAKIAKFLPKLLPTARPPAAKKVKR